MNRTLLAVFQNDKNEYTHFIIEDEDDDDKFFFVIETKDDDRMIIDDGEKYLELLNNYRYSQNHKCLVFSLELLDEFTK